MRAASGGVAATFFIDRSLGGRAVAAALRERGALVELHDDHFSADCADSLWLPAIGRRGWVVLTRDREIRYHRNEVEAARGAGVAMFILRAKNLRGPEMGVAFAVALPRMLRILARTSRPFIAHVSRSGEVEVRDARR